MILSVIIGVVVTVVSMSVVILNLCFKEEIWEEIYKKIRKR